MHGGWAHEFGHGPRNNPYTIQSFCWLKSLLWLPAFTDIDRHRIASMLTTGKHDEIEALLDKAVGSGDVGQILGIYNDIVDVGLSAGFCSKRTMSIHQLCPHKENREGAMCNSDRAETVLEKIETTGVDLDLLKDCTGFEESADQENMKAMLKKIEVDNRLVLGSNIGAATTACTHFVQACLMVDQGKPSNVGKLCMDGKLSKEIVLSRHPKLRKIFDNGIDILVWKHEVQLLHPRLPDLSQRALNVKFSTQQGQDAFQMQQRAVLLTKTHGGKPDFIDFCTNDLIKSNSGMKEPELRAQVHIARKFAGANGEIAQHMLDYIASRKGKNAQQVPANLWIELGKVNSSVDEACPNVVWGCIATVATSETDYKFAFKAQAVKSLFANKDKTMIVKAEKTIRKAIDIAKSMGLGAKYVMPLGKLQVLLTLLMTNAGIPETKNRTIEMLACQFFEECYTMCECDEQIDNPWLEIAKQQQQDLIHARKEASEPPLKKVKTEKGEKVESQPAEKPVKKLEVTVYKEDGTVDITCRVHNEITKMFTEKMMVESKKSLGVATHLSPATHARSDTGRAWAQMLDGRPAWACSGWPWGPWGPWGP